MSFTTSEWIELSSNLIYFVPTIYSIGKRDWFGFRFSLVYLTFALNMCVFPKYVSQKTIAKIDACFTIILSILVLVGVLVYVAVGIMEWMHVPPPIQQKQMQT